VTAPVDVLAVPVDSIERIVSAALGIMAKSASNREPGESFEQADIVSAVLSDPHGSTALHLATLIGTGLSLYPVYAALAVQS
jgi:hypothetical protein